MKNLLEFILNHIVDHPEDVLVDEYQDDQGYAYTIHVHQEDIGRVIGKHGRIIQAIRNIVKVRAVKEHVRAMVNLAETDEAPAAENAEASASEAAPETASAE